MESDPEAVAEYLVDKEHVYKTEALSTGSVVALVYDSNRDDVMCFEGVGSRGYRVGMVVPAEGGDTWLFVPMDGDTDA